jgi:hypothetical protein
MQAEATKVTLFRRRTGEEHLRQIAGHVSVAQILTVKASSDHD